MAAAVPHKPVRTRIGFGHPSRMVPETREVTLLILAHLLVFLLAMAHDEIVAEPVADGWFLARFAERSELLIGLVLFVCWSALTVRLVSVVKAAAAQNAAYKRDVDRA